MPLAEKLPILRPTKERNSRSEHRFIDFQPCHYFRNTGELRDVKESWLKVRSTCSHACPACKSTEASTQQFSCER